MLWGGRTHDMSSKEHHIFSLPQILEAWLSWLPTIQVNGSTAPSAKKSELLAPASGKSLLLQHQSGITIPITVSLQREFPW